MDKLKEAKNAEYNNEPVFYCPHCLSLKIRRIPGMEESYCDECSNTDVKQTTIEEWEKLYVQKYGHKYIEEY